MIFVYSVSLFMLILPRQSYLGNVQCTCVFMTLLDSVLLAFKYV